MYIAKNKNIDLHWWGDLLLLVQDMEKVYIFEDVEKVFIEYLSKGDSVETVKQNMAFDLNVDNDVISNFVENFVENFKLFFSVEEEKGSLHISGEKSKFYPLEIHISLTNTCIQMCKHCYKSASSEGCYLNYDFLKPFLLRMRGFVPYLVISGGEPTLHPQFSEIINDFFEYYKICVLTSGVTISKYLDIIARCEQGMVVSLYSSLSNIHDEFVQRKDSYNNILANIKVAISKNIPVGVTTILTQDNIDDVILLVSKLSEIGVSCVTIGQITTIGRARDNGLFGVGALDSILREKLEKVLQDYPIVATMGILEKKDENGHGILPLAPFNCSAGTLTWSITERGQIQPCGICSMDELALGTLSDFDESILSQREEYIQRVKQIPCIKYMYDKNLECPFGSCCR